MKNLFVNIVFLLTLSHGMGKGVLVNQNCRIFDDKYYSPVFNKGTWTYSDWMSRRAQNSEFGPITDRRWGSFETTHSNYSRFVDVTSISFSFYSKGKFVIFFNDFKKPATTRVPISVDKNNCQWRDFKIIKNNDNVSIEENGEIIKTIDVNVDQIVIRSEEKYFWKWHNYTFLEAEHVTDEKPSTLVLFPGKTRYTLYTSLCKECYLNIKITNSKINVTTNITSSATCKFKKCWKEHDLFESDIEEETKVDIFRRNSLNKTTGYWALDIRSWINSDTDNSKTTNISELTLTLIVVAVILFIIVLFFAIRRKTTRFQIETNDNLLTSSGPHEV